MFYRAWSLHHPSMIDSKSKKPLQEPSSWRRFHLSECLEYQGIEHCIAGDVTITALDHPLVLCQLYLVITDEQLVDALTVMLQQGLEQVQGAQYYVDQDAANAPLG